MAWVTQGSLSTVPDLYVPVASPGPLHASPLPSTSRSPRPLPTVSSALNLLPSEKPRDCQVICSPCLFRAGQRYSQRNGLLTLPSRSEPEQGKVGRNGTVGHPHPHHLNERPGQCVTWWPWLFPNLSTPVPAGVWKGWMVDKDGSGLGAMGKGRNDSSCC